MLNQNPKEKKSMRLKEGNMAKKKKTAQNELVLDSAPHGEESLIHKKKKV
jgi:hypothetical protein